MTVSELLEEAAALVEQARLEDADVCYARALEAAPGNARVLRLRGALAGIRGDLGTAREWLLQALLADGEDLEIYPQLARVYQQLGQLPEAIQTLQAALRRQPRQAVVHNSLGLLLQAAQQPIEALQSFRQALKLDPRFLAVWSNMGSSLQSIGRLGEAESCFRRALELDPERAEVWNNLGYVLQLQVRHEEALDAYQRAMVLRPDFRPAHSNLIFGLLYQPQTTPELLLATSRDWERKFAPPLEPRPTYPNLPDPERRIVVGYVSPNFRHHSDANFLQSLLAAHNHGDFEIICYSDVGRPDDLTRRIRPLADKWRDIVGLSDASVAEQIRADGVDLLLEVTGQMAGNRLTLFAHRAAPVQISYHGQGTTGLSSIDYRLTDRVIDPPEYAQAGHCEELYHLERCFACYATPRGMPELTEPPAKQTGYITFASFNNLSKTGPGVVALWSEILRTIPRSRLILKAAALADRGVRERYTREFLAHGIAPQRVELLEATPSIPEHLALYSRVDIALDPFPYSGSLTTWEALWMGVPVITLAGRHFIARQSASLLMHLGLRPLVTDSPLAYLDVAQALASDVERLADMRSGMRRLLAGSPVADNLDMGAHVEQAYRTLWRRWCASQGVSVGG